MCNTSTTKCSIDKNPYGPTKYGKLNHTHSQHQHQALALRSGSHSSQAALWTVAVPLTLIKAQGCALLPSVAISRLDTVRFMAIYGIHMHQLISSSRSARQVVNNCEWRDDSLGNGKANSSSARCSGCSGSSTGTLCSLQIQAMHMNAMQCPKDSYRE